MKNDYRYKQFANFCCLQRENEAQFKIEFRVWFKTRYYVIVICCFIQKRKCRLVVFFKKEKRWYCQEHFNEWLIKELQDVKIIISIISICSIVIISSLVIEGRYSPIISIYNIFEENLKMIQFDEQINDLSFNISVDYL